MHAPRRRNDSHRSRRARQRQPRNRATALANWTLELPPAVRDMVLKRFTGDLDGMVERGDPRRRSVQSHLLLRGPRRAAGRLLRNGEGLRGRAEQDLKTGQDKKVSWPSCRCRATSWCRRSPTARSTWSPPRSRSGPNCRSGWPSAIPPGRNVSEVVVTGPGGPPIASADDLSGKDVWVRADSKYKAEPGRAERQAEGQGQAARRDPGGAGEPRGRRPAGDGQRRPDADHHRRRLSGDLLEEDLHRT